MEVSGPCLSRFLKIQRAKKVVKEENCFKNKNNPLCVDLSITENLLSFQNTCTVATVLSDIHKIVFIALKMSFQRYVLEHSMQKFKKWLFKEELTNTFENTKDYNNFESTFLKVLNGIQTIAPRGKLFPGQAWGLGQSQGQFQGWRATRQLSPRKIVPELGLGIVLGLVLGLRGNFPRGQLSQNHFK